MATIIDQNDTAIGLDYIDQPRSAVLSTAPNLERGLVTPRLARVPTENAGITVIVPCFNEESMATATVRRIAQTLSGAERPFEVIIVDDGSTDATATKLESLSDEPALKVLHNPRNRGYGYSIKRAVALARYELIAITDADGTYPNERITELVDLMADADMVVGARTGDTVYVPLPRRPAKWALRRLAAYLTETEIPDLNSGLRVMKKSLIRRFLSILPDGFSFTTTITLALLTHGFTVRYVSIDYARRVGRSSIRPIRDTLNFFSLIVRTVMYFKPLKIFAPASAAVFAVAILVALISKLVFGQVADITAVTLASASIQLLAIGLLADLIDKRSPATSP